MMQWQILFDLWYGEGELYCVTQKYLYNQIKFVQRIKEGPVINR